MSVTDLTAVANQIQTFWSPLFMDELRADVVVPALLNKEYEGAIKQEGDRVRVSQINAGAAELRTVGTDADVFNSQKASLSYVDVIADKVAISAYEFTSLAMLQSQLASKESEMRKTMVFEIGKKISDYCYSLVAPSTSSPDHLINSVSDFNAAQLANARMRAAQAKWGKAKPWYILADPSYYTDLLNAQTLTSSDYVGGEEVVVAGQIVKKRFNFNILEDNGLATDQAVIFHPDFMHLVMQTEVNFKLSDLHSQKKRGYLLSAEIVFGAKLGIDGSKKHQLVLADASLGTVTTV